MPKSIDGYNINFFTDKYRKNNVNDVVDYSINGNTLYASYNAKKDYDAQFAKYCDSVDAKDEFGGCYEEDFKWYYKPLTKSLTVDIELPDGYFTGGSWKN